MTDYNPQDFFIFAVDDNPVNCILLKKVLRKEGYQTEVLSDSEEVIPWFEKSINRPDLILLDLMMPKLSGLELCEKLKLNPHLQEIPIIFITASDEKEDILKAFDLGAVDYITKPFNNKELLARVKTHIELKFTRDKLTKTLKKVETSSITDVLTGIYNRHYFTELAQREFSFAKRQKRLFSLLILNIDKLKKINDSYGNLAADYVIKSIAQDCLKLLRKEDLCARWGAEEFIVFLSETSLEQATIVANRLRQEIENQVILFNSQEFNVTVSIGISTYHSEDQELKQIFARGDIALSQAKNTGRNKVVGENMIPSSESNL